MLKLKIIFMKEADKFEFTIVDHANNNLDSYKLKTSDIDFVIIDDIVYFFEITKQTEKKYDVTLQEFDLIKKTLSKKPKTCVVNTTCPLISVIFFKSEHTIDKIKEIYCCMIDYDRLRIRKLFDDKNKSKLALDETLDIHTINNNMLQTHAMRMNIEVPENKQTFSAFMENPM